MKTLHTAHGGKMSIARVLSGTVPEGAQLTGPSGSTDRASGVFKMFGQSSEKRGAAQAGETVALGKLDHAKTGDTLGHRQAGAGAARHGAAAPSGAVGRPQREGAQGRRQARPGAQQAGRGRPVPGDRAQSRDPRGDRARPGRDAPARRDRTARRPLQRRRRQPSAQGRVPRDHPQAGHAARTAQEAVGRPRPVRRRGGRHQAAAARRRLQVRRGRSRAAWCRATTFPRWRKA